MARSSIQSRTKRGLRLDRFAMLAALAFSGLATLPTPALAAKFANQFTEFELPAQWQCSLEGAEWVCQSTVEAKKKDAMIILAAKLKGDQDSLDQYLAYLKQPKNWTSVQGKAVKSEPRYANNKEVNGQAWVDSLHADSELPGFYTRYLTTIKSDIAVLITFSVNRAKYSDYIQDIENLINTLKVFRKPGGINSNKDQSVFNQISVPQEMAQNTVFPNVEGTEEKPAPKKDDNSMMLLILGGAAVAFFIWRKRQNRD